MNTIGVKVRETGKAQNFAVSTNLKLELGDYVIVEQERGCEYGIVASEPSPSYGKQPGKQEGLGEPQPLLESDRRDILVPPDGGVGKPRLSEEGQKTPILRVIRKATAGDMHQIDRNKTKVKELIETCEKKIDEHKLPMKLVDAEYSFDRSKVMFYFTADTRVDFRNLVKDLAAVFKARIELKQIGVRDEAKLLGGFGPCGQTLCCAKFLKNFQPVTIKMAKEQNLSLNPTKISGLCGRLMCCLSYEYDAYKELMLGMPHQGDKIKTKDGAGIVISINAIKRLVVAQLEDGRQVEVSYKQ